MTKVQIDDYDCEHCGGYGMAELDIREGVYTCGMCGKRSDMEVLEDDEEFNCQDGGNKLEDVGI